MNADAKFLKRKIKPTLLDVHHAENALVVSYEVEAQIFGELGDPMLGEKKESQKLIRIKNLNEDTDIDSLTEEVVSRCSLIHASRYGEVRQLLYYLQTRKKPDVGVKDGRKKEAWGTSGSSSPDLDSANNCKEIANLNDLDDYIDLLYEDVSAKCRGAALILQLTRNPDNLEEFVENEVLLSALSRVLREDWKRNLDLATNLVYCFYCFSVFSQFHKVIQAYKIGSLCMEIVQHEFDRRKKLLVELEKPSLPDTEEGNTRNADKVVSAKKLKLVVRKQNQLLRVCFYLLLNLSEDTKVEQKMRAKGIIRMLVGALTPESGNDLVILVLTFLQRLSVYVENKNEMAALNVMGRLAGLLSEEGSQGHLFQCDDPSVVNLSLRLLFNLSFDPELRAQMVKEGIMPKAVSAMEDERHRHQAVCILYHLSMDDKNKSMFTYTQAIPLLMKIILESGEEGPGVEVMALVINLAANKKNAVLMCGSTSGSMTSKECLGLKLLFRRAFKHEDALIMKVIRNIAQHDGSLKGLFMDYVGDIVEKMKTTENEEFALECLGVLGNLNLADLDWSMVANEYQLLPWLGNHLGNGDTEDDLRLEVIILLGTMAKDESCARTLLKSGIMQDVLRLLNAKQEDDEVVLQIVYLFHQFVVAAKLEVRMEFMRKYADAVHYMIDLMHDANSQICKLCDATLDVVASCDPEWAVRIKEEKFRHHNAQWLEMVKQLKERSRLGLSGKGGGGSGGGSRRGTSSVVGSCDTLCDDALSLDDSSGHAYDPQANLLDRSALFAGSDTDDTGHVSSDSDELVDANLIDGLASSGVRRPRSGYNNR